eukprot:27730-Pelagococcus_subviridis.AAC.1
MRAFVGSIRSRLQDSFVRTRFVRSSRLLRFSSSFHVRSPTTPDPPPHPPSPHPPGVRVRRDRVHERAVQRRLRERPVLRERRERTRRRELGFRRVLYTSPHTTPFA